MVILTATLILTNPQHLSPGHAVSKEPFPPRSLSLDYSGPVCYQVVATAYTAHDAGMDGRGITFSGALVEEYHTIAVDPEVIPLGSLVCIPHFEGAPNKGWFVAQDTGSAIKGKRIDVYMPLRTDALEFGVKALQIYVYAPRPAR